MATVTESNLAYEGSITIDKELMDMADILPYEQVMIVTSTTAKGSRHMLFPEGLVQGNFVLMVPQRERE